jgi:hypothetical protein
MIKPFKNCDLRCVQADLRGPRKIPRFETGVFILSPNDTQSDLCSVLTFALSQVHVRLMGLGEKLSWYCSLKVPELKASSFVDSFVIA